MTARKCDDMGCAAPASQYARVDFTITIDAPGGRLVVEFRQEPIALCDEHHAYLPKGTE